MSNLDISIHHSAWVDSISTVGKGTKIWHFCHTMEGAEIGENCTLGQNVFVGGSAKIGNRVRIQNNVSIYDGVEIGDDVFLGPSCVFTNVKKPRGGIDQRGAYNTTKVCDFVTVGANATIVCGIEIGKYAFIGAGAVVTKNVPPYALMMGVPAKQVGLVDEYGNLTEEWKDDQ